MKTKDKAKADELLARRKSPGRGFAHPPPPRGMDRASVALKKADEAERLRLQRHEDSEKQREYIRKKHRLYHQRKTELEEKREWFDHTFLTLLSASNKIKDRKEANLEARRLVEKREEMRIDIFRLKSQTRRRP